MRHAARAMQPCLLHPPGIKHGAKKRGQQEEGEAQHCNVSARAQRHARRHRPRCIRRQGRVLLLPLQLLLPRAAAAQLATTAVRCRCCRSHCRGAQVSAGLKAPQCTPPLARTGFQTPLLRCCLARAAGSNTHHCCGAAGLPAGLLPSAAPLLPASLLLLLLPLFPEAARVCQLLSACSTAAATRERASACQRWLSCAGPGCATSSTVAARASRLLR